jgi:hypothetical protein
MLSLFHTPLRSRFKKFPEFTGTATESKKLYVYTFHRLRDADRRKPEKWEANSWFFLHYNAPAHWSL